MVKHKYFLDGILLFIIALFAIYTSLTHLNDESIWIDGYGYLIGGWWLKEHLEFTDRLMKTQAYIPVATISLWQFIVDDYLTGKLMNLTFILGSIPLLYFIGRELKNRVVGVVATIIFLTIPIIYYLNKRSLVDFPLGVMYLLTSYFYIKFLKTKNKRDAILTGLSLGLTFLSKSSGVILIGIIGIHLLMTYKSKVIKMIEIYYLGFTTLAVILPIVIMNLAKYHKPVLAPNDFSSIAFKATDYMFYLKYESLQYYFPIILFIPACAGLYFLFKRNKNIATYFITYIFIYLFLFSIVKFQDPRFMTPISGLIAIIAAIGLEDMRERKKYVGYGFYIAIFLFSVIFGLVKGEILVIEKSKSYIGYKDLETYYLSQGINDSTSYVSSKWTIEFITRNFYSNPLEQVKRLPSTLEKLNETLVQCLKDYEKCYVQIDIWEYTQPQYAQYYGQLNDYYANNENIEALKVVKEMKKIGLKVAKVVYRWLPSHKGNIKVPVIILFETY